MIVQGGTEMKIGRGNLETSAAGLTFAEGILFDPSQPPEVTRLFYTENEDGTGSGALADATQPSCRVGPHLTEVNGKDTRVSWLANNQESHQFSSSQGGYIEGKLEFDPQLLQSPFGLKITLVRAENTQTYHLI